MSHVKLIALVFTLATLSGTARSGHVQNQGTLTIQASTATSFEDGSGIGVFVISRVGPTTQPLNIHLRIGGSATNGVDYLTIGNEVEIPAGASSVQVNVKPINDTDIEADELVTIGIGNVAINSTFDKTLASVTIKDNDTVVQVETVDANGSESGSRPIVFRISRNGNIRSQLTVNYTVNNSATLGTTKLGDGSVRTISSADATAGFDFAAPPGSVTFDLGETNKLVSVVPHDDALVEGRETVTLSLVRSSLYTLGIRTASGFIDDDDQPTPATVSISIVQANVDEDGSSIGTVNVSRAGPTTQPLTVFYSVNDPSLNVISPATNGRSRLRTITDLD